MRSSNSFAIAFAIAIAGLATGCTKLGPTPSTTALTARPIAGGGAEVQGAIVPGQYLSESVVADPQRDPIPQLSVVVDVGRWTSAPGLVVGARTFGQDGDAPLEPIVGYRRELGSDGRVAVGGYVYGTRAAATSRSASYEATRVGGEVMTDTRLSASNRWLEAHAFASASATYLDASGSYCTVDGQWGADCDGPSDPMVTTSIRSTVAAANLGGAIEFLRDGDGWFHGGRLAMSVAAGSMPRIESGHTNGSIEYVSFGMSLSLAVGEHN